MAACALAVFFFVFDPVTVWFFPRCLFHTWTGLYCPGCGSSRAWHQLLHGHVLAALKFNALAVLVAPLVAGLWAGERLMRHADRAIDRRFISVFLWSLAGAIVAFWLLRNIPVSPFCWLAPGDP